jgi:alpha-ketoglutarate-dependent taurine dioxygenase
MSIDIKPIKKHIGATVHVERAEMNKPEVVRAVLDAVEERGVLVFPRINLTDEEQIAFTDSLGDRVNFKAGTLGAHKAAQGISAQGIYQVTLDPKVNLHPEYVFGTFFWHMDGMPVYDIPPPKATLLSARRLSSKGGQTQFASTAAAYEALPEEEKANIDKLRVVHSIYAAVLPTLDTEEEHAKSRQSEVKRERPLVWTQSSGRKSLIIGHTADRIVGWPVPEGRALLERLMEWSAQPDFMYSHEWEPGDLVIWNNSGVLHRVIPYDRNSGRMMHRTSLAGVEAIA